MSIKLYKLFNNIKESRIVLHTYQDLMQNTQKYKELGSVLCQFRKMQTSHSKHSKACLSSNHIIIFDNKPANNPLIWSWYILLLSLLKFGNDYITF